ncbi:hypothetical protein AQUCO_05400013v1 [Aquilegia coerulea]|uniref:Uncharacterized protein n=1 Tax=Aquilegia coerulea TaxID=218851 RepID=A0A2G5CH91_AQUCA|nr:hypothetical protein AQUCO_05400013v1 [Aquilegia coerulea]
MVTVPPNEHEKCYTKAGTLQTKQLEPGAFPRRCGFEVTRNLSTLIRKHTTDTICSCNERRHLLKTKDMSHFLTVIHIT